MLSAARAKHRSRILDGFRLRGREVTRLESFSDAVFGFALTLLVVSLDVPRRLSANSSPPCAAFPPFALCFLLLVLIWNAHYKFCRRYGLDDGMTRFLTCLLLFLVLFYVYPLKFLFSLSVNEIVFGFGPAADRDLTAAQLSNLLIIYGLGFAAVYFRALSSSTSTPGACAMHSNSTKLEQMSKRASTFSACLSSSSWGCSPAALACSRRTGCPRAGFVYILAFPIMRIHGASAQRRQARTIPARALDSR